MSDRQPDAEEAVPWAPGRPPVRTARVWPMAQQPAVEVRLTGEWCRARVAMRQDRADGATIYHLDVLLPDGTGSASRRAVVYDPTTFRLRARRRRLSSD
jgi:hypothetical protein